jgi:glycosidase
MKRYKSPRALDVLEQTLRRRHRELRNRKIRYTVPALWSSPQGSGKVLKVNPFAYYLGVIAKIKKTRPGRKPASSGGEWTRQAVIYNMFIRTTTSFDHDGNGKLDLPVNAAGFRETGTFLKALAMLPYIKRLGANTVHLLPTTSIGQDGNKGTLGSPYAIRNPYELDEGLSEPAVGLDAKTEFRAFVEAAHRLGLRVVVEFVFRTAAKDGDWVKEHPEWFYWIRQSIEERNPAHADESRYGSPIFTREELERIHQDVREQRLGNLLPPGQQYRNFFTEPPKPENVAKVDGRYVGTLSDGTKVKIPGAFADWPPDDSQPPWGDVTYLRMYTHPDFNYIAYNTIRMYDTRLTRPGYVNRPLWDRIIGIIPYYQKEFHIDGVMIDMGHALPMDLKAQMVRTARTINPDFAFWDENFSVTAKSREEGYNAVFGYLWVDEHRPDKMRELCHRFATDGFPIPFFATPESHNTPRAAARPGGLRYAKWAMVINSCIPAVPFIHSGYELAERYPINTGLDFTREELQELPSEKLPLFSEYAYHWQNSEEFSAWVKKLIALRQRHQALIINNDPRSFVILEDPNRSILAFARVSTSPRKSVAVIANPNMTAAETSSLCIESSREYLVDLLTGTKIPLHDRRIEVTLHPGQCLLFEW